MMKFNLIKTYRQLKKAGILSMNQRNADLVLKHNNRKLYPIVDDKLQTKRLAIAAGIAVPELYAVITTEHQLREIGTILAPYEEFVLKPAHGSGGDGIIVITGKVKGRYRKANGSLLSDDDLAYHLSCTLSGAYSLGGHPDTVLIEKRVQIDPIFEAISYEGVPDIRVITLFGYPVMSMVRLPTRVSDGKANLHQGAIGAGIDLATGKTLGGVWRNETIDYHPDTLNSIVGLEVPYWDKILHLAAQAYELTGLGYIGVDIVLDKTLGPLILELNARPGLSIQIANREGLVQRCEVVEKQVELNPKVSAHERVLFSRSHFLGT
jgi:alpha-L-glutamate ligase-like protein